MLDWIEPKLTERQREAMREIRADAKVTKPEREQDPSSVRRIEAREQQQAQQEKQAKKVEEKQSQQRDTEADQPWDWTVLTAALLGLVFLTGGLAAGLRGGAKR